nr:MAG TPA: hypothetical protein [Caudoviricetes sp.]
MPFFLSVRERRREENGNHSLLLSKHRSNIKSISVSKFSALTGLLSLISRVVRQSPFSLISMQDSTRIVGLTVSRLGILFVRVSRLLYKVAITLEILRQAPRQHKQHNRQLWPEHQTRRIRRICFLQPSRQRSRKGTLATFPSSLEGKLKLIKDTFNAEIV